MDDKDRQNSDDSQSTKSGKDGYGTSLALGVAIGVVIGAIMDNVGMGIAIGIAIGIALKPVLNKSGKDKNDKQP